MLDPLYWAVSWVLRTLHSGWALIFDPASGIAWALAIISLTIVIRLAIFPLFVKQVRSQRAMQALAPEMKAIQQKYAGDRQGQAEAMQALYKEHGANPMMGCLPLLIQMPIFLALFNVLNNVVAKNNPAFGFSQELVDQARSAKIFGAPIAATFLMSPEDIAELGGTQTAVRVVAMTLVVAMSVTMFLSQRQIMVKHANPNMEASGQAQQIQKIMLYGMPVVFLFSGVNFPIGTLIYWTTSNVWSAGQQFFIIRKYPLPHQIAAKEAAERAADTRPRLAGVPIESDQVIVRRQPPAGQRRKPQQRKKSNNRKR
jgi:YidC/Oxa1 family membrane protein insertase